MTIPSKSMFTGSAYAFLDEVNIYPELNKMDEQETICQEKEKEEIKKIIKKCKKKEGVEKGFLAGITSGTAGLAVGAPLGVTAISAIEGTTGIIVGVACPLIGVGLGIATGIGIGVYFWKKKKAGIKRAEQDLHIHKHRATRLDQKIATISTLVIQESSKSAPDHDKIKQFTTVQSFFQNTARQYHSDAYPLQVVRT